MNHTDGVAGDRARLQSLLLERAEVEWLRGERILAVAPVGQMLHGRHRVRGLDHDGLPRSAVDRFLDSITDSNHPDIYTVVRGDHPQCSAVGLYKAAGDDHTWLAVTADRVAVLRMRDTRNEADTVFVEVEAQAKQDRSLGGLMRGVGKLVSSTAVELARSVRRPPLADRPDDAVLECPFELPSVYLRSIAPWKPRLLARFRHGPKYVQVHFADGSSACLETTSEGVAALTGSEVL
jgi:hypothetical protein